MDSQHGSGESLRNSRQADSLSKFSIALSALALLASTASAWTANRSLAFAQKANEQTQRTNLFLQFQSQYYTVTDQFPPRLLEPSFRPVAGSSEYARLEAFWLFSYSVWFASHKVDSQVFEDMWYGYYVPLVGDGLAIPSLHYVLENSLKTGKQSRGSWNEFLKEVARVGRETGHPLSPASELLVERAAAARDVAVRKRG